MTTTKLPTATQGRRAFDALAPQLAAIPSDAISRPHTDPYGAALTALLVSDWLTQPEVVPVLGSVAIAEEEARELGRMSRAILMFLGQLGGDYLPDTRTISAELMDRGHAVRTSTLTQLEQALPKTSDTSLWLDAVRSGRGPADLVYDLRTLAKLCGAHRAALSTALATLPELLLASADAIEVALRADETEEHDHARAAIGRLWTLFVPLYERAAAAGRSITRQAGAERSFPPLALIASHQRTRRRAEPRPPASTESYDVVATVEIVRSEPPPAMPRSVVDLEVGIASESNFYVGFTENLSATGVFVATYAARPIGSRVEIALTMPSGEPMRVKGVVRWTRDATADGWPGIGVEFESLAADDEQRIQKFLALREPMFFEA